MNDDETENEELIKRADLLRTKAIGFVAARELAFALADALKATDFRLRALEVERRKLRELIDFHARVPAGKDEGKYSGLAAKTVRDAISILGGTDDD